MFDVKPLSTAPETNPEATPGRPRGRSLPNPVGARRGTANGLRPGPTRLRSVSPYVVVAAVVAVGLLLFAAAMGARALLAPKAPTHAKLTTYESGVDPVGRDWAQTQI